MILADSQKQASMAKHEVVVKMSVPTVAIGNVGEIDADLWFTNVLCVAFQGYEILSYREIQWCKLAAQASKIGMLNRCCELCKLPICMRLWRSCASTHY